MKKVFYSLLKSLVLTVTLSHFLPLHGQEETLRIPMTTEDAKNKYSTISMQRTSVHDPSIVYDEGSRLYYVFGSHMATAKTRDLQNWTGVSFPWGTVDTDGTITSHRRTLSILTKRGKSPFTAKRWISVISMPQLGTAPFPVPVPMEKKYHGP